MPKRLIKKYELFYQITAKRKFSIYYYDNKNIDKNLRND